MTFDEFKEAYGQLLSKECDMRHRYRTMFSFTLYELSVIKWALCDLDRAEADNALEILKGKAPKEFEWLGEEKAWKVN